MKKIYLLTSFLISFTALFGQDIHRIASPAQLSERIDIKDEIRQASYYADDLLPSAQQISPQTSPLASGIISTKSQATVNPIQLGRSSNMYSGIRVQQNQVFADDDLGLIAFVHRQDVNVWGGGNANSGKFRYDISVDGGSNFTTEIGILNPVYTSQSRYPSITGANPDNVTNPFNTYLAYSGATLNSLPQWDEHVTGLASVSFSSPVQTTENYNFTASQTFIPGGLCQGQANEFWTVESQYDGLSFPGDIYLYKGEYNSASVDIIWSRHDTISPLHYTGYDGTPTLLGPNISFSPNGNTGWMAWIGDLVGGPDSTLQPIFLKTTDGGNTWGNPIEVDLNADPLVAGYLKALWTQVDLVTGDTVPVSTGRATCFSDYDITVDMNGNPHMAVVIGSAAIYDNPEPGYIYYPGLAKFLADVWSPDGGLTWKITYISPVLTFRGIFGNPNQIFMENYCQISRTPSGDHIFYSWVDTDTSAVTGSQNGIGFGISENLAPNLRISAMRVTDEYQRCITRVSDGDSTFGGNILFPTMAPEVVFSSLTPNEVALPIVVAEALFNDPLQACRYWYFGTDAKIDLNQGFYPASTLDLSWDACILVGTEEKMNEQILLGQSIPNPTTGEAYIEFQIPFPTEVVMDLTNGIGQQVRVLTKGSYPGGKHRVDVNTGDLPDGIYFYNLRANNQMISKKMVVARK